MPHFRRVGYNILYNCEQQVDKLVDKLVTTISSYAHKPQAIFYEVLKQIVNPFLCSYNKQLLHTIFVQFISVKRQLCAVSTGPTITTTIIK